MLFIHSQSRYSFKKVSSLFIANVDIQFSIYCVIMAKNISWGTKTEK